MFLFLKFGRVNFNVSCDDILSIDTGSDLNAAILRGFSNYYSALSILTLLLIMREEIVALIFFFCLVDDLDFADGTLVNGCDIVPLWKLGTDSLFLSVYACVDYTALLVFALCMRLAVPKLPRLREEACISF